MAGEAFVLEGEGVLEVRALCGDIATYNKPSSWLMRCQNQGAHLLLLLLYKVWMLPCGWEHFGSLTIAWMQPSIVLRMLMDFTSLC